MKQGKETKKTPILGIYTFAYYLLRNDLELLQALNNELPRSIEQIVSRRDREFEDRFKELNRRSRVELRRLLKPLEGAYVGEPVNSSFEVEVEDEEVINLLLQKVETKEFSLGSHAFIREMSLVYLIAKFESFLRRILQVTYEKKPEILMSCQKTMKYEDLIKLGNYANVIRKMIDDEISSKLNEGIDAIDRYFNEKFGLELSQLSKWKEFRERFYRRHVLVHNSGIANEYYRLKTGYQGKSVLMEVSAEYLSESIELFEEIALKISGYFYNKFR